MSWLNHFYRGSMLKLNRSLTKSDSVKNYEIRISRSNFTLILEYFCRVSFLTTLDIYKDYFKGHHKWWKVMQRLLQLLLHAYCDRRHSCPSSSYSLWKLLHLYAKGFVTKELPNLHCWMNWRTLQPTSSSSWCVSHILGSVQHWLVMY